MGLSDAVYQTLTSDDEGRVCRDVPEAACRHQPVNFVKHVASLAATKTGDGLVDPKLVLSWLLGALGVSAAWIGWLVPVREAGSLLPQLVIAGAIRSQPVRKWVWAMGSSVQGFAVLGMAWAALRLEGPSAGAAILGLLALFALARAACSVSYKDVLGKTVSKSMRGTATGAASTIGAAMVLLYGVLLSFGLLDLSVSVVAAGLAVAGGLWLAAAATFSTLAEEPGATEGGGNPLALAVGQAALLRQDPQLRRFIGTRALLLATALAPPYLLAVAGESGERSLGELGPFVLASGLAAVSSTYVWGRLADLSSRRVLALSAALAALALGLAAGAGVLRERVPAPGFSFPALLFALMIAYQGVRLGRSTHVVDMADERVRAAYTALSNTTIGVLLAIGGVFGAIASRAGETVVLGTFAALCLLAVPAALGLEEVQRADRGPQ